MEKSEVQLTDYLAGKGNLELPQLYTTGIQRVPVGNNAPIEPREGLPVSYAPWEMYHSPSRVHLTHGAMTGIVAEVIFPDDGARVWVITLQRKDML